MEAHGKKMSTVSITIAAQVGKDDKMFRSVTAKDIAEGLAEQGFTVDRRKIQLAQPIKELGTHAIAVKLPREVTATIAVPWSRNKTRQKKPLPRPNPRYTMTRGRRTRDHARRNMQDLIGSLDALKSTDLETYEAIVAEEQRQQDKLLLIASENFASPAVLAAQGQPDDQ
ncbi:MAG: hypothetical protein MRJ92_12135 [Nitrospira sp.]|nr:hypothetical protein [Nitrospira sp.]